MMHQPIDPSDDGHDTANGALCTDDGRGMCVTCGVDMTTCDLCGHVGYHGDLCPDSDETIALAIVRSDLIAELDRVGLFGLSDAVDRCDHELLRTLRMLGFAGRDSLTAHEFSLLRRTMHPVLVRVSAQRSEHGP